MKKDLISKKRYEALVDKIESDEKITSYERDLLEGHLFNNYYASDDDKRYDSNWAHIESMSDKELIADIVNKDVAP